MQLQNVAKRTQSYSNSAVVTHLAETRQLGKKQDHAEQGTYITNTGKKVFWCAVFDGHGTDDAINIIRASPLDEIMRLDKPYDELNKRINKESKEPLSTGSTMLYVKTWETEKETLVEITNIGDCQAVLFVNGTPYFMTEPHNSKNSKELIRLITERRIDTRFPIYYHDTSYDIISLSTVTTKKGEYFRFKTPEREYLDLAHSQALGHKCITGLSPDRTTISLDKRDKFKVVLFSDGVGDLLPVHGIQRGQTLEFLNRATSADQIMEEAERRWKQEWNVFSDWDLINTSYSHFTEYDDCACCVLEWTPFVRLGEIPIDTRPQKIEFISNDYK